MQKEKNRTNISIYNFLDYKDYLHQVCFPDGKYGHTAHNLKSLAKKLGYKSPSSLTMVIKGDRLPSFSMIEALAKEFKLNSKEREYFVLMVEYQRAKSKNTSTVEIERELESLSKTKITKKINTKTFSLISEWYFLVIKNLIQTDDFIEDPEWIFKKLRKKVTISQIRFALQTLSDLQITKRDPLTNKLILSEKGYLTTNDIPSEAIQRHHLGMLERASESITEQEILKRQINSVTLQMDIEKFQEAKEYIYHFVKDFNEKFTTTGGNNVYQLNVQLFEHTKDMPIN